MVVMVERESWGGERLLLLLLDLRDGVGGLWIWGSTLEIVAESLDMMGWSCGVVEERCKYCCSCWVGM